MHQKVCNQLWCHSGGASNDIHRGLNRDVFVRWLSKSHTNELPHRSLFIPGKELTVENVPCLFSLIFHIYSLIFLSLVFSL